MNNDLIIIIITWCACVLLILGAAPIIPDDSEEAE